jgi:Flp pilus assembly protein TadD
LQRAVTLSGRHPDTVAHLASVFALQRRPAEARRLLEELNQNLVTGYMPAFNRALVYAALGDRAAAFHSLEQAFNERYGPLALIRVEPDLASLRGDPRFAELVRKIFP